LRRRYPSPATKSTTEECDAWRERALQLEAELHAARTAATTEAIGTGFTHLLTFLSNALERISLEKAVSAFCGKCCNGTHTTRLPWRTQKDEEARKEVRCENQGSRNPTNSNEKAPDTDRASRPFRQRCVPLRLPASQCAADYMRVPGRATKVLARDEQRYLLFVARLG